MSNRKPPRQSRAKPGQEAFDWQSCLQGLVKDYGLPDFETKAGVFWHLRPSHSEMGDGEIFEAYPPDHPMVATYPEHAKNNPWLKVSWRRNTWDGFAFLGRQVTPHEQIIHDGQTKQFYEQWMVPNQAIRGMGAILFKQVIKDASLVIMVAILRAGRAELNEADYEDGDRDRFERDVVPKLCQQVLKHPLFEDSRFAPFLEAKRAAAAPEPEPVVRTHAATGGFVVCRHPLIATKLSRIREGKGNRGEETYLCDAVEFRQLLRELGMLLGYEATRDLPTVSEKIDTPRGPYKQGIRLGDGGPVIVSILRSGAVLAEGVQDILRPTAPAIGHIGIHREKDNPAEEPPGYLRREGDYLTEYLVSLPPPDGRPHVLVDAVVGTGETMCRAIEILRESGVGERDIRVVTIIASLSGRQTIEQRYPDVRVFCAAIDKGVDDPTGKRLHPLGLNAVYGVVPGIGAVSERLFGFRAPRSFDYRYEEGGHVR